MRGRTFASDNWAGVHPDVLAACGGQWDHVPAYGEDPLTGGRRGCSGSTSETMPRSLALNGTGANVVGLQSLLRPFEAVICAESAHINVDECGAPERFLGQQTGGCADTGRQTDP